MPELPEVETILRGLSPHLTGKKLTALQIRQYQLRWPITPNLAEVLKDKTLISMQRRGKYLLFSFDHGTLIIHLGMSGKLTLVPHNTSFLKHDHCDFIFANTTLRYHDPRRFGAILWTHESPFEFSLLKNLGPEPLTRAFNAQYLQNICQNKSASIKSILMNSHVVVGVGNIYANEALFLAKIHPAKPGYLLDLTACQDLTHAIKFVLKKAIKAGGTTLKDFSQANGRPGYFKQELQVYGKQGKPCPRCQQPIVLKKQQQRATYFCAHCQAFTPPVK